jgi:hypothetical protein
MVAGRAGETMAAAATPYADRLPQLAVLLGSVALVVSGKNADPGEEVSNYI